MMTMIGIKGGSTGMKILLIVPDQPGINNIPEVRAITSLGRTVVLSGTVTVADVYQQARYAKFDIIHFATHGDESNQMLSNGEAMSPEDVAQCGRQCGAHLIFFSSCRSGLFASYVTRHGVRYAVHTNIELKDRDAWKLPSAFYDILNEAENAGKALDYVQAFLQADSGDGSYGLAMPLDIESVAGPLLNQLRITASEVDSLTTKVNKITWLLYGYGLILIVLFVLYLYSSKS
ncbi:hypothetical protein BH10CHL1_BH10CHL1_18020 [soil metagenome]